MKKLSQPFLQKSSGWLLLSLYVFLGAIKRFDLNKNLYWILIILSIVSIVAILYMVSTSMTDKKLYVKENWLWITFQLLFFSSIGIVSLLSL